ncbi:hsp70 nucleotide exchange factor fes1, partial [Linnemannia zychae]
FLKEKGLQPVIDLLSDPEPYVRAKAIYALSGAIKHFEPALKEFKEVHGYKTLVNLLNSDSNITMLRKIVFLMNTLLIQDPSSNTELADLGLVDILSGLLKKHMDDEDLVEKSLVTLKTFFDVSPSSIPAKTLATLHPLVLEAKEKYGADIMDKEFWADLEKRFT